MTASSPPSKKFWGSDALKGTSPIPSDEAEKFQNQEVSIELPREGEGASIVPPGCATLAPAAAPLSAAGASSRAPYRVFRHRIAEVFESAPGRLFEPAEIIRALGVPHTHQTERCVISAISRLREREGHAIQMVRVYRLVRAGARDRDASVRTVTGFQGRRGAKRTSR
jgi:hypothetical protein